MAVGVTGSICADMWWDNQVKPLFCQEGLVPAAGAPFMNHSYMNCYVILRYSYVKCQVFTVM